MRERQRHSRHVARARAHRCVRARGCIVALTLPHMCAHADGTRWGAAVCCRAMCTGRATFTSALQAAHGTRAHALSCGGSRNCSTRPCSAPWAVCTAQRARRAASCVLRVLPAGRALSRERESAPFWACVLIAVTSTPWPAPGHAGRARGQPWACTDLRQGCDQAREAQEACAVAHTHLQRR